MWTLDYIRLFYLPPGVESTWLAAAKPVVMHAGVYMSMAGPCIGNRGWTVPDGLSSPRNEENCPHLTLIECTLLTLTGVLSCRM